MYASACTPIRLKDHWAGKLAPVTSLFAVQGDDGALALNKQLLVNEGAGHTAIVHTGPDHRALGTDGCAARSGSDFSGSALEVRCAQLHAGNCGLDAQRSVANVAESVHGPSADEHACTRPDDPSLPIHPDLS